MIATLVVFINVIVNAHWANAHIFPARESMLALQPQPSPMSSSRFREAARPGDKGEACKSDSFTSLNGAPITTTYTGLRKTNIELLVKTAKAEGITNPKAIVGMLCVIGKESQFVPQNEKMNYSPGRLAEVWSRFSKTCKRAKKGTGDSNYNTACPNPNGCKCSKAEDYARNAEKLANLVYCCKYGNGDEASGDGFKYRGRGFNQITFKGTYEKYKKLINVDIISNPDLLNKPEVAAKAAVLFLLNRFKIKKIDPNSFSTVKGALEKFAGANAGWGKSPDTAIRSAQKIREEFKLTQEGGNSPGICGEPGACKGETETKRCNGGSDNVCCLTAGTSGKDKNGPSRGGTHGGMFHRIGKAVRGWWKDNA